MANGVAAENGGGGVENSGGGGGGGGGGVQGAAPLNSRPRARLPSISPPKKHASVKVKPPSKARPTAAAVLRETDSAVPVEELNEVEMSRG